MVDPGIHAEMTILIRREKELERELSELKEEIPVWNKRVDLALSKGMEELAEQAREREQELRAKAKKLQLELEMIDQEKSVLRYESRRPSGAEVARSEAMLESVRLGGLVDPDRLDKRIEDAAKGIDEESDAILDFSDD